jgi:deferrochelatase/peroxidase EfeB
MNPEDQGRCPFTSRRGFLAAASGLAVNALVESRAGAAPQAASQATSSRAATEPFWGEHQSGILTAPQGQTYFAAFDLMPTAKREDLIKMLRDWTLAASRLTRGETLGKLDADPTIPAADSGEAIGLPSARLTVTFGFGPGLFLKDGQDRYGLATRRPEALVDLPKFAGDQLIENRTGGDLSVQACSDDPQVAFHAVRQLNRLADGIAQLRWVQSGFIPQFGSNQSPRNLMGFKDGTNNPSPTDSKLMDKFVWADDQGPQWMRGGSYLVIRRIRIALEHWDRMSLGFQQQSVGRGKYSGAPLGGHSETDPVDLDASDKDGNPIIPDNSHIRLASPDTNDGARIFRRSYSYNDGVNFTSERWPPWRQGMEYDAGLLFIAYQKDPRTGFIKIFDSMSKFDMMNQFVTHVGGGLFACPPGIAEGEFIGQQLFSV